MTKVLLIDDEPDVRQTIVAILNSEGYRVYTAENGPDGIAAARKELPELILCDVMMPDMDGHAVLQALQANRATASIPFIFLTAKCRTVDVRTGMNLGADDYLTKPVSLPDLLDAVRARLRRQSQQSKHNAKPDFASPEPLRELGLTRREAEVLFWVAQGKTSPEISVILEMSTATAKKHLEHVFQKLGVENRAAAILIAIETLSQQRE